MPRLRPSYLYLLLGSSCIIATVYIVNPTVDIVDTSPS